MKKRFLPKIISCYWQPWIKNHPVSARCFLYLWIPQKIVGVYALISGLAIIVFMSYLGSIGQFYSVGILGALNASVVKNPSIHPTFLLILYQNMVVWLAISLLFIVFAKIFQPKRLRLVDFFWNSSSISVSIFGLNGTFGHFKIYKSKLDKYWS